MKRNIIIFGAGDYGTSAYLSLKNEYNIICFADNNTHKVGQSLFGIEIIAGDDIRKHYNVDTDVVVCIREYLEVESQLSSMGIIEYYVMTEGFLYSCSDKGTMMPVELSCAMPYKKNSNAKTILYVQNRACIRTHKIASLMKNAGYEVFLLYTLCPPVDEYEAYRDVYSELWHFTSVNGIIDFINKSEFDIVHCSNEPDILANVVIQTSKPVVFDTHDMQSIRSDVDIETLSLEYIANTQANGNIYTSEGVKRIAKEKYDLTNNEVLVLENLMEKQYSISEPHEKISRLDNEIHCVYEGGVVGHIKENHRYFEDIWLKIASQGIHIHFYSQSDEEYCKKLATKSEYLHFEGNVGGFELIKELTKYDLGLAIFNVTPRNKTFLETGSANKVYEYLNARLPIIVGDVQSYIDFVTKYNVGIRLDMEGNIKEQLETAKGIRIEDDFLDRNGLTMISKQNEIVDFYERVRVNYERV